MISPIALPPDLRRALGGYAWQRIAIGESTAAVHRLHRSGEPDLILKFQPLDPTRSLSGEIARLRWLQGRARVPEWVDAAESEAGQFLLMSALPGTDAASSELPPTELISLLARAMRELHAMPIAGCPFDESIDHAVAQARTNLDAGAVDAENFDAQNLGRDPRELFAELIRSHPGTSPPVMTHGDFCLPNLMVDQGRFAGFIDLGRFGVGDRYRDLALVGRSLARNLGTDWERPFLKHYGLAEFDLRRMHYFALLDEFF